MDLLSYPEFLRPVVSVFLALVSLVLTIFGMPTVPHGKVIDLDRFELTWSDEFDCDSLDRGKWGGHYIPDNGTVERKGSYWNTDLASVSGSNLRISTEYFEDGLNGNGKPGWYTCGIDTSRTFSQKYGYFEVRCILPKGTGLWSAFWMFNSNIGEVGYEGKKGAEIDIYESPYFCMEKEIEKNAVSSNLHIDGYGEFHQGKNISKAFIPANNPYEEFNTYGLEWNENEYIFYINGVETGRTDKWVSQEPEWLILSVEVGGENAKPADSWAGESLDLHADEITDFIVDYVRVYQYR